jgi:hypothetical protein
MKSGGGGGDRDLSSLEQYEMLKMENINQYEEEERMKVRSLGVAGREVGKLSKSKRRRRKDEGTFPRGGWP